LHAIKETGEIEEYTVPKRPPSSKPSFQEQAIGPDLEIGDDGLTDVGLDLESESFEGGSTTVYEGAETAEEGAEKEEEEDPFSDKNRWKRGVLDDQDTSQW